MGAVREIERHRRQLNSAFDRVSGLALMTNREELESDYARYLCVLISGFAERSVVELILAYSEGKAATPLRSYLSASLQRQTNLDKEKLCRLVGSLDAQWGTRIEEFVKDERQAALNSIVGLRNNIAHGGTASPSLRQIQKYWTSIQEIIGELEAIFLDPKLQRRRVR